MAHIAGFVAELRRRRVLRVAGIYIVGAWAVLQVADLFLESLGFPDTALFAAWVAVLAGFPLALIFGWRYDITPQGIVRTPAVGQDAAGSTALKWPDFVILGALALVGGIAAYNAVTGISEVATARLDFGDSVAVMPLDNLSGEPDYFAAGMHDALITSLSKIPQLRVTSRTSTLRVGKALTMPEIARTLGVTNVVEGSVTREGDRVHYHHAWLLELLGRDEEAIAFGVRTKELDPLSSFYTAWLGSQYQDAGAPSGVPLALVYAAIGDRERTFEWLRFAKDRHQTGTRMKRPEDRLPDVRDGLTGEERVVLIAARATRPARRAAA